MKEKTRPGEWYVFPGLVCSVGFGAGGAVSPLRVSETRSNREKRPKTAKHKGPFNIKERPFYTS